MLKKNLPVLLVLLSSLLFNACSTPVSPKKTSPSQIVSRNFDWDDNIFYMPTSIIIFNDKTGTEKKISTEDFAVVRTQLGKKGEYKDFKTSEDPKKGSFRYFRDGDKNNYFLEDIKLATEHEPTNKWQGPEWNDFVDALSHEATAQYTTIITARGHKAESMLAGLIYLKSQGFIKNLPPVKNLYAVSHPSYKASAANPAAIKAKVMEKLLDSFEAKGVIKELDIVLNQDGTGKAALHLWDFSDDDYGNFSKALEQLSIGVKKGRWPHIKITLYYTGKKATGIAAHAVVIKSDGTTRPQMDEEKEILLF